MAVALKAVATLASSTGLARDSVTNQFCFSVADGDGDEFDSDILGMISAFYTTVAPNALMSVGQLLSPTLSRAVGACRVEIFDITNHLDGSPAGSPFVDTTFTLPAAPGTSDALPSEVAYVATLEALGRSDQPVEASDGADPGTAVDRPKQRYTGRVYIGPLGGVCVSVVDGVARPSNALRDTVNLAVAKIAADTYNADTVDLSLRFCVWSRTDQVLRPVNAVSGANDFDTQRRRGEGPTVRTRVLI